MPNGFLTLQNKNEIINNLIIPTIQNKYGLTIDSVSNFSKLYDGKARRIHRENPTSDIVAKNMILIKELIEIFKKKSPAPTHSQIPVQSPAPTHSQIPVQSPTPTQSPAPQQHFENEFITDNNGGVRDVQMREKNALDKLDILLAQRDKDIQSIQKTQPNYNIELDPTRKDKADEIKDKADEIKDKADEIKDKADEIKDNIIMLDENMEMSVRQYNDTLYNLLMVKKILLTTNDIKKEAQDTPYIKVTIDNKTCHLFNMGICGCYYLFEASIDFPIDIKDKSTITVKINLAGDEEYKQNNTLIYLNYYSL